MEDLLPLVALIVPVLFLAIPIVAILTHHQRKMADIIHGSTGRNLETQQQIAALQAEVAMLRDRLNAQVLAADSLSRLSTSTPPATSGPPPIEQVSS